MIKAFLDEVIRLDCYDTDGSLDLIFDRMDEWALDGNFDACDQALAAATPSTLSVTNMLGFLCITLVARERLTERAAYVERVRQELTLRGDEEHVAGWLRGLE